jgi:hypothetical protein
VSPVAGAAWSRIPEQVEAFEPGLLGGAGQLFPDKGNGFAEPLARPGCDHAREHLLSFWPGDGTGVCGRLVPRTFRDRCQLPWPGSPITCSRIRGSAKSRKSTI